MNLEEIKARVDKATEGPWTWQDLVLRQERQYGALLLQLGSGVLAAEVDCDFIAHAREDVPALITLVEWLQSRLVRAHRMLLDDLAIIYPESGSPVEQLKAKLLHDVQEYLGASA